MLLTGCVMNDRIDHMTFISCFDYDVESGLINCDGDDDDDDDNDDDDDDIVVLYDFRDKDTVKKVAMPISREIGRR